MYAYCQDSIAHPKSEKVSVSSNRCVPYDTLIALRRQLAVLLDKYLTTPVSFTPSKLPLTGSFFLFSSEAVNKKTASRDHERC